MKRAFLAVIGMLSIACGDGDRAGALSSGRPHRQCIDTDGDGYGDDCAKGPDCDDSDAMVGNACYSCEGAQTEGCACAENEARIACGRVQSDVAGQLVCGEGERVCLAGQWSECLLTGFSGTEEQAARWAGLRPLGLVGPSSCADTSCDPGCQEFLDTPDESVTGEGVIVDGAGIRLDPDSGTVVAWEQRPNGPVNPEVHEVLEDAGAMPSGAYFYHELLPGESSDEDALNIEAEIRFIDVYFLLDTSATMGEALVALGDAMGGPSGVIASVTGDFPNARFGVGHFHGYQSAPHDISVGEGAIRPLWHTLNLGAEAVSAQNVMLWLGNNGTTSNNNSTEAFGIALYASASAEGLFRGAADPDYYWVGPRNESGTAYEWLSDYGGSAPPVAEGGACPAGSIGYPCFAPGSTPITVVMTDNPTENGPGGHFAYGHGSGQVTSTPTGGIPGSSLWPDAVELDARNNGREVNAVTIDPTAFARYAGDMASNGAPLAGRRRVDGDSADGVSYTSAGYSFSSAHFPTTVPGETKLGNCNAGDGGGGREAFFSFSLHETAFVHFDTWGSERDVMLYVIDAGTRERVACNNDVNWISGSALGSLDPLMRRQSTLEARLGAGDYVLVLDEKATGACPSGYSLGSNDRCYRRGTNKTWNEARASCQSEGADLAIIGSAAEDALVAALFSAVTSSSNAIGLVKEGSTWKWVDGTGLGGYSNWDSGEPGSNPCARRKSNGAWEDRTCASGTQAFLCEVAADPSPSGRYFLQVGAMDDGAPVAVPSFEQTVAAQQALGGKVIGIDVSGMGPITAAGDAFDACDCGASGAECESATQAINRWTYLHLQEAARRTGSVDGTDANPWTNPFVFSMDKLGGPCHDGVDPPIGAQVTAALTELTQTLRQDISVEARDSDDTSDLDEGPSADRPYGFFIEGATVVPLSGVGNGSHDLGPGGLPRCLDDPDTSDVLEGCLPDTRVRFHVTFSVPAAIAQGDDVQIFQFEVATVGSGQGDLGSKPALIVVPPAPTVLLNEGWFTRDYDMRGVCPWDSRVVWGHWFWQADAPDDSQIDFFVRVASAPAELDDTEEVPLRFSDPPGPAALAGQPIGVRDGLTETGAAVVHETLFEATPAPQLEVLRLRARLGPTSDRLSGPTLEGWKLQISCAESL